MTKLLKSDEAVTMETRALRMDRDSEGGQLRVRVCVTRSVENKSTASILLGVVDNSYTVDESNKGY